MPMMASANMMAGSANLKMASYNFDDIEFGCGDDDEEMECCENEDLFESTPSALSALI